MTRWPALLALVSLAACAPKRPLPDLPATGLAAAQPALAAARGNPNDAAVVARLGMTLHAYNLMGAAAQVYERAAGLDSTNTDYAYLWGTALTADGRYAEAIGPLRGSLAIRESAPVRLRLADALYDAGKTADARREYETLIASDGGLAAAHYGLGRCLQGDAAIASFEKALQLFPRYGAAQFALAGIYRQQGKKFTLANYERDKLLSPPMPDPAMAAVQALDESATGLLRAAQSLEREGQFAQAAALQERALAADPKLTQAWVNLISLYARLGNFDRAESAYKKAIALEPKHAEANYNYGVLCAQAERFDQSRLAFETTISIDPGNAEALDNLGAIVERSGAWDRAAGYDRRALALKPGLCLAHYHLGRILANQKRYAEAIGEFEKSIEPADEQTPGYLYALGATHARAGHRDKAIEILRRAQAEAARWGQGALGASIASDLTALTQGR